MENEWNAVTEMCEGGKVVIRLTIGGVSKVIVLLVDVYEVCCVKVYGSRR